MDVKEIASFRWLRRGARRKRVLRFVAEQKAPVMEKPNLTIVGRRDFLGWSTDKANKTKRALLQKELISEFSINLGTRTGGTVKLLELTDAGFAILDKTPRKKRPGKCSAEHWFYQRELADLYRSRGYCVRIEHNLNGARADLGVEKDGKLIAIEVAISPANEVRNVQKDLAAGFSKVLIACKTTAVKKAVLARLNESAISHKNVKLMLLSEFPFPEDLLKPNRDVRSTAPQVI